MDPVTTAIVAATAANAVVVLGAFALWLAYRSRRAREQEQPKELLLSVDARLRELTRALDTVAVEVERLGEAQRYLALQSQARAQRSHDAQPGRVVTPH